MKSDTSSILIDNYFGLLKGLSTEYKIKLIAKLSNSILEEVKETKSLEDKFYGAFKSKKNAEEIISEIRESRIFNRTIESF